MISSQAKHGSSVGKAPGLNTSWLFPWLPPSLKKKKNRGAKQLWPGGRCSHDQQARFSMHPDRVEEAHPQQMPEVHQSLGLRTDLVILFLEQLSLFPTPFYLPGSHIEVIIFEKADSQTGCGGPGAPMAPVNKCIIRLVDLPVPPQSTGAMRARMHFHYCYSPPPHCKLQNGWMIERVAGATAASFGRRWSVLQFGFLYFYGCARLWGEPGKFRV